MLKEKDLKILSELRINCRQTLTKISKKTSIPISTVFDKLENYRKDLVVKFTCLLNFNDLGLRSHSFVVFSINKKKRDDLKNFLLSSNNVNSLFRINHRYDFLVELVFRDIQELENFMDHVDEWFSIRPKHIFYVIDSIAKELILTSNFDKQKP